MPSRETALISPLLLDALAFVYVPLSADGGPLVRVVVRIVCCALVLLPPTCLMGATLPLILRSSIAASDEIGPRIGLLYGINTAGASQAQGIGFAVPSNTAQWVLSEILTRGRVRRAYLGIAGRQRPLGRRLMRFHRLAKDQAVEVVSVAPESPAAKADLHVGDLIVAAAGRAVGSVDDLHRIFSEVPIGSPVPLRVVRWTEQVDLVVAAFHKVWSQLDELRSLPRASGR